ncbi:hypothetical protein L248_1467 [Schleiferilactobacillus shenzhenensis LY-73]|uniref:Uncharacterized protein n=1 Tax=Schleiferilactobacillus shenzhenensis LY-73 TaxID=1231336 RepID=U4TJ05_9LACO|nr:hypothetical protein L248_1467 [Schleiferilactobacillus shenzhenensis LY-73]
MLPLLGAAVSGLSNVAKAAENSKVDIVLHKKAFATRPDEQQNTGEIMPEFESAAPLKGALFTAYNITTDFHDLLEDGEPTGNEDMKAYIQRRMQEFVAAHKDETNLPESVTKVDSIKTDDQGLAKFTELPAYQDGKHQVYIFYETENPAEVAEKSSPMIVVLPVKNKQEQVLSTIHLYPKNIINDVEYKKEMIDDQGQVLEGTQHVQVGDKIQYYLEFTVPHDIGHKYEKDGAIRTQFEKFNFSDAVDKPGLSFVGLDKIVASDELETNLVGVLKDHFKLTSKNLVGQEKPNGIAGFDLSFNFSKDGDNKESQSTADALSPYANKKLRIYYTLQVNEEAMPDEAIINGSSWTWTRQGTDGSMTDKAPEVVTGGKKFVKIDGTNNATLEGAKFVLTKKTGEKTLYAQFATSKEASGIQNEYHAETAKYINWIEEKESATTFISGENGKIEVRGLKYGEYQLVETKAPTGYSLLKEATPFTVEKGTWSEDEAMVTKIKNIPEGGLPSTGGPGIVLFLLAGFLVMSGGAVWFKFSRQATA